MTVIELRQDGEVRITEKVRNPLYFHAHVADVFAYARAFGLVPGVNCEVVTSNMRKEEHELTKMTGA